MQGWLVIALLTLSSVAHAQADHETREAKLRARADSIARLDPAHELSAALERGDRRCIAVQGYAPLPTVRSLDSVRAGWPLLCAAGMNIVPGTSDLVTPGVGELNVAAWRYGERYNQLLLVVLRREQTAPVSLRGRSP